MAEIFSLFRYLLSHSEQSRIYYCQHFGGYNLAVRLISDPKLTTFHSFTNIFFPHVFAHVTLMEDFRW
jgi:hypothetical protein